MTRNRSRSVDFSTEAGDDLDFVSLSSGHRLAYAEYGDPAGVPVVFIHGTPGSRLLGALFDDQAADSGVRLLAYDRPGFGRSSPCRDQLIHGAGTSLTAVLDELGIETAGLIAFSGGSRHAVAAVATHGSRISRMDIVSGATPPDVSRETPPVQRVLSKLATTTPVVLRGLLRGQTWLARRLDPSFVVNQYTAGDPDESIPDDVAEIVRADFVEALSSSRRGTVTEFRNAAMNWNVDFEDIDTEIRLWHGEDDTNVPIEDVQRFASTALPVQLQVLEDADHIQALLRSVPDILNEYR